jgi:hypothetical protein
MANRPRIRCVAQLPTHLGVGGTFWGYRQTRHLLRFFSTVTGANQPGENAMSDWDGGAGDHGSYESHSYSEGPGGSYEHSYESGPDGSYSSYEPGPDNNGTYDIGPDGHPGALDAMGDSAEPGPDNNGTYDIGPDGHPGALDAMGDSAEPGPDNNGTYDIGPDGHPGALDASNDSGSEHGYAETLHLETGDRPDSLFGNLEELRRSLESDALSGHLIRGDSELSAVDN